MRIGIIGSGTVGYATGKGLLKHGHEVIFNDINLHVLSRLQKCGYAVEKKLDKLVSFTDISFVCVQTPNIGFKQDLSYLENAIIKIGKALRNNTRYLYYLVTVRSTVLPGTMRKIILPLFKKFVGFKFNEKIGLCYNPEFLREKYALEDFLNPSRIVIGETDRKSGDVLYQLYRPFNAPIIRTDLDTAEMIKYVSNVFLATKISFFNEIYEICQKLNINDKIVSEAVSLDPRIGKYGIYGGRPFGGKCLPKDLASFVNFVSKLGIKPDLFQVVMAINEKMSIKENYKKDPEHYL